MPADEDPTVSGFIIRGKVYAPDTVEEIKEDKLADGKAIGQQFAAETATGRFTRAGPMT